MTKVHKLALTAPSAAIGPAHKSAPSAAGEILHVDAGFHVDGMVFH